jgi:hypothetical protein
MAKGKASGVIVDGPVSALEITGIKCDADGCDYQDQNIPRPGEKYESYLNAPCPKCGAPLLTEADLKLIRRIERATNLVNRIGKLLGLKTPSRKLIDKYPIIPLSMRGDGSLTVHPMREAEKQ